MTRIEGRYANGGTSPAPEASESVLHAEQIDPNEPTPTTDFIDSHTTPGEDEEISINPSVDSDEITDILDYTGSTDERIDVPKETESTDDVTETQDYVQSDDESDASIDETPGKHPSRNTLQTTFTTDTESQREREDQAMR